MYRIIYLFQWWLVIHDVFNICQSYTIGRSMANKFIDIVLWGIFDEEVLVFDSRLQLCYRKRKQEHFWIILWRSLELLKGKKCQKTTLSVNSLKYQFELVSLYVTSNELFIYYSYRLIDGIKGIYPYINGDNLLWSFNYTTYTLMSLRFGKCLFIFKGDGTNVPSFLNPLRQNTGYFTIYGSY